MAENKGELNEAQSGISRRNLLKKGAIIGAGLVAGGAIINAAEVGTIENGISTESGTFFPLYETHYKGIEADKMPENLDVLFCEATFVDAKESGKNLFNPPARYIIGGLVDPYLNETVKIPLFSDPLLKKTAINGIEIMFGDVYPFPPWGKFVVRVERVAETAAGLSISLAILKDSLKKKGKSASGHVTRRTLLKGAGLLGAAWLIEPSVYVLSRGGPWGAGKFNIERENALNRIIDRVNGISSSMHPEDMGSFFRNLIMADKMLAVAEGIEQRTGKKAKIGFNVEYGHNGIEDFLRVGHDVCRWIIAQYPKPVLQGIADVNGGNESLWAARLFKLPKDFFEQDPEKRWDNVGDRKVIDVELKEVLEKKLA